MGTFAHRVSVRESERKKASKLKVRLGYHCDLGK